MGGGQGPAGRPPIGRPPAPCGRARRGGGAPRPCPPADSHGRRERAGGPQAEGTVQSDPIRMRVFGAAAVKRSDHARCMLFFFFLFVCLFLLDMAPASVGYQRSGSITEYLKIVQNGCKQCLYGPCTL